MLLFDKLKEEGIELILASQSPRRRDLMADCGFEFKIASYEVEEKFPANLEAEAVAEYLSDLKSNAFPQPLTDNQILITADTVVICDDQILGKPKDEADARAMLELISNRQHKVITGVTIRNGSRKIGFSSQSNVFFRELSQEEISYYIEKYRPMDKAGSYGIQEWIGYVGIEKIEGSFYNVMGLPIQRLYTELNKFVQ